MVTLIFIVTLLLSFQDSELRSPQDLQWRHRVLVYVPDKGKPINDKGLEAEMADLNLIWFELGNELKTNYPKTIHPDFAGDLKRKFPQLGSDNWILIGLDGGTKLSGKGEPDWGLIFSTINAMPMRQAETKRKKKF